MPSAADWLAIRMSESDGWFLELLNVSLKEFVAHLDLPDLEQAD
jgi:hypothetical protein